jgi:putative ABC transport system substrate-binding protein
MREAQSAGRLQHPNIVTIRALASAEGSGVPLTPMTPTHSRRAFALICGFALMTVACGGRNRPAMDHRIGLVYFAPEEGADACMKGLFDGLKAEGFEENKNLEVRRSHAQAEISNIPLLIQNYDGSDVDVIVAMTTPVLAAASSIAKRKPVVFTYVYDPIAAGAGTSRTDHRPNVTGVGSFPPVQDTVDTIQKLVPNVKSVGTLYNSSEANSVKVVSVAKPLFMQRGITLEEIAVTGTNDVFQAAQAITQRNVQALWVTGDNTALQAFPAIAKAARDAKLPLIINDPEFVEKGALMAVGIGWYETGRGASKVLARVLRGEKPQVIPFEEVAVKKLVLNQNVAKALGITFSPDIVRAAQATPGTP